MSKCPECDGTGKVVYPMMSMNGDEYTGEWEQHECDACDGKGFIEQTNEEWFDTLSTEEKAETIANATYYSAMMGIEITALPKEDEVRKWKMWLKQPHTNKE